MKPSLALLPMLLLPLACGGEVAEPSTGEPGASGDEQATTWDLKLQAATKIVRAEAFPIPSLPPKMAVVVPSKDTGTCVGGNAIALPGAASAPAPPAGLESFLPIVMMLTRVSACLQVALVRGPRENSLDRSRTGYVCWCGLR